MVSVFGLCECDAAIINRCTKKLTIKVFKAFLKVIVDTLSFSFMVTKTKGLIRFKLVDPNGNKSITYGGKYSLRR
jgi:hypothetical protein